MIDFHPAPVRILVENSHWLKEPKLIYPKPLEIPGPLPLEKRRGRPPKGKPGSVLGRKRARNAPPSRGNGAR